MTARPAHLGAVLEGLAGNPALPPALIRRMLTSRHGSEEIAGRDDLTPDLIDEILRTGSGRLLHSLALNRHVPEAVHLILSGHRDASIRTAVVVGSRAGSRAVPDRLIADPDRNVRLRLAESDHVPVDLRSRLAHDPDPEVRATLAEWWPQAPERVRRILLTDPVDAVRAAACATYYRRLPHPVPPADLVPALLDDPVTRAGAVLHATLTRELAARLAQDPDDDVRRRLARHPRLPADLRDVLAEDPNARVRVRVLVREDTPESLRERIHRTVAGDTRRITDLLTEDLDDAAFLRQTENIMAVDELKDLHVPWVTGDPLPYVDSPYVCFRASAARSTTLPASAVARLLDDDESIVRTTMAQHAPALVDAATAERIDREFRPSKRMRWRPADDVDFPSETLRRFATDADPRMRCLAPRDPDLPAEIAGRLTDDPDPGVRAAVATHPRLPTTALVRLLADDNEWVARTAASAPLLPVSVMEQLLSM